MAKHITRRTFLSHGVVGLAAVVAGCREGIAGRTPVSKPQFDPIELGAVGDGRTLDTDPIQRALDAAANAGRPARVVLRGGRTYLAGSLQLRSGVELYLARGAVLLVSTEPQHFPTGALLSAVDAHDVAITGDGVVDGRSREFMERYDAANEWWVPKRFRPRLALLTGCTGVEVSDVTFRDAPSWTLHLLGCERVLVDGVTIRNQLDVPNCDGIDPDHCRDVEIRNCDIACGDDAIVIKTTRQGAKYGPSTRIYVHDCVLETQDSGLKIGTETTQDISDVRFERCTIKTGCRGLCIQLRDEGNISNIEFRDIRFTARYFSAPWWGRGEGISFTALPRAPGTKLGVLQNVRVIDVTGRAENSVRIDAAAKGAIRDIRLENVALTVDRWTTYAGAVWDNRPTTAVTALESHDTPGIAIRRAVNVLLQNCRVAWGRRRPDYFMHALEAEGAINLRYPGFVGEAARPDVAAVAIRQ